MDYSDILLHSEEPTLYSSRTATPPIFQASNFIFSTTEEMRMALAKENEIPFYSRGTNPTVRLLEKEMALLEGTEKALAFASGSAAISAAILSVVKQGDHIISVVKPYSWTAKLIQNLLSNWGVTCTWSEAYDAKDVEKVIQPNTRLIFLESPNSWTFEMQDLESIAALAKSRNIKTLLDNSYATPLNQSPSHYGIDFIAHSATKYLAGHSDLVAGILCGNASLIDHVFKTTYMTLGAILSPFDAWLLIRSLRTWPLRMKHIGESTMKIVDGIYSHPKIKKVFYPHAQDFIHKELANKYLKNPGGLFTIDLKVNESHQIEQFCNALKYFKLGCSWGSYESLAFPALTTLDSLNYNNPALVKERIRLSVGLDDPKALLDDILQALEKI